MQTRLAGSPSSGRQSWSCSRSALDRLWPPFRRAAEARRAAWGGSSSVDHANCAGGSVTVPETGDANRPNFAPSAATTARTPRSTTPARRWSSTRTPACASATASTTPASIGRTSAPARNPGRVTSTARTIALLDARTHGEDAGRLPPPRRIASASDTGTGTGGRLSPDQAVVWADSEPRGAATSRRVPTRRSSSSCRATSCSSLPFRPPSKAEAVCRTAGATRAGAAPAAGVAVLVRLAIQVREQMLSGSGSDSESDWGAGNA